MANALTGLDTYQWAMESTKGTDLATTSKMVVEEFTWTPEDENYRPMHLAGLTVANRGNEQAMWRGTRWNARGKLTFQQAIQWLEMSIAGAVSPTGTDPYTWTYTRSATAVPTIDAATFERRLSDGSNVIGNAIHYAMLDELTLSGDQKGMIEYAATGFARRIQTETLTAGQTLPSTLTFMPHGTSALYIDDTWAGRGTTVVSAQLLNWSLKIRPGHEPFFTADGRSDLDFPTHILNTDEVKTEFTARLLIPGTGSQYATEKTAAEASSLRACELRITGSGSFSLKLQFLATHEKASLFEVGTLNGQRVVDLSMVGSTDLTNYQAAVLVNNTATDA